MNKRQSLLKLGQVFTILSVFAGVIAAIMIPAMLLAGGGFYASGKERLVNVLGSFVYVAIAIVLYISGKYLREHNS